jgi:putative transposase
MRCPAAEKLEIIRLVAASHLPVRRTLEHLGVPPATFYRWCDLYQAGGPEALDDKPSRPDRVWNRIPDAVRSRVLDLALAEPELSPRELAVRFTEQERYFVSEASAYRLLKAHDLITSPAFVVVKAADEFHTKTTAPNQLWQTDFTYLKVTGWGWYYLSTVLDDFSRYVIAWKLCTTMAASNVTDTLELALAAPAAARLASGTARGCCPTTGRATSRETSPSGSPATAWSTSAARRATRRRRARSSAGTRRSRTASCSRTTTCPANWRRRSRPSSTTTTTAASTRAWTTSPRPTSTSGEDRPSCVNVSASSGRPSSSAACCTSTKPPSRATQVSQSLR